MKANGYRVLVQTGSQHKDVCDLGLCRASRLSRLLQELPASWGVTYYHHRQRPAVRASRAGFISAMGGGR